MCDLKQHEFLEYTNATALGSAIAQGSKSAHTQVKQLAQEIERKKIAKNTAFKTPISFQEAPWAVDPSLKQH